MDDITHDGGGNPVNVIEEGEITEPQVQVNLAHYNDPFEILYYRYGFVHGQSSLEEDGQPMEQSPNTPTTTGCSITQWELLTKTIGTNASKLPKATIPVQLALQFVGAFCNKEVIPNLPLHSWDLDNKCSRPLRVVMGESCLAVCTERDHKDKDLYIVRTKDCPRLTWTLVVKDPVTVLEIIRRSTGPNLENTVNFLVHTGVPFNTAMVSNTYPPPPRFTLSPFLGLGTRLRSLGPDAEEYQLYEETRDDFLRGPFGRAALLAGGIIWRLAKEIVPIHDVFSGPSELAQDYGKLVYVAGKVDMIDDDLTEQSDLIVGVYHINTSQGDRTKRVSWWPKPLEWEGCDLDVGYWSSTCEAWFQNRLSGIRKGRAGPRTEREWRDALVCQHQTATLVENTRQVAQMFLSGHIFSRVAH